MDTEHFRQLLLRKKEQLESEIGAVDSDAHMPAQTEPGDAVDDATIELATDVGSEEGAVLSRTLQQVEAALRRIDDGTYGKCVDCGRPIDAARLDAIPWAEYCREHQP